jgi:hypothetical protein
MRVKIKIKYEFAGSKHALRLSAKTHPDDATLVDPLSASGKRVGEKFKPSFI